MFEANRVHRPHLTQIATLTVKNSFPDKPNEDALLHANSEKIFVVADGVSRLRDVDNRYPNPSAAVDAARLLVDTAYSFLRDRLEAAHLSRTDLANALHRANEAIARYNATRLHSVEPGSTDPAGAVGLVAHLRGNILHYAYLGDVELRHVRGDSVRLLTVNQTTRIEEYIRRNKGTLGLEKTIRSSIRNNPHHPDGWGVLTGEDTALHFIHAGEIDLAGGDRVLISSDGLLPALNGDPTLAQRGTPEKIIEAMLAIETLGQIRSDDKTVLIIDVLELTGRWNR